MQVDALAKAAPRDEPLAQRDPRVDPQPGDVVGPRRVTRREGDWIYYRFNSVFEASMHLFYWKGESRELTVSERA